MLFELPEDPVILLGIINMKLRDFYHSMDSLCDDLELDFSELDEKLMLAGFKYDSHINQYRKI